MQDVPLFEVTLAAELAEDRRLVTAAAVRAMIGSPASDDTLIATIADGVSADCVDYCGLARARDGTVATFGYEELRATWLIARCDRGRSLWLPWRVPVAEILSVVENDVVLVEDTDFRRFGDNELQRLSGDQLVCWSGHKIVVEWAAGWELPDGPPQSLVSQVIEQVKLRYRQRKQNPGLRSMSTEGVGSASYSVPGGDTIGESGLLLPLETALVPFRSWALA